MAEELTAAERQALEWVRDQDERAATLDPELVAVLSRKGLIFDFRFGTPGLVGTRSVHYAPTAQGRTALEPQRPG